MSDKISKNRQNKIEEVGTLKEKLARAKAIFFTEYTGLKHQQLEQLKKALKKVEAEFVVAKNTLTKIALTENKFADLEKLGEHLKNPTATLLSYGDEIAAIKVLFEFIKKAELPRIKIGIFGGKLASTADFNRLATLPSREMLLAMLVSRLNSPIQGLHYALSYNTTKLVTVLNNVKKSKHN